jgi:GLPGLI family protein
MRHLGKFSVFKPYLLTSVKQVLFILPGLLLFNPAPACAQKEVITITYQLTSYGGHKSEQILKLWDRKTHFALRKKDEELISSDGITYYHYFLETDIYTDSKTQKVTQTRVYDKKYPVIASWPFQPFDWKLTQETKEVAGYQVQKATAKAYYYDYGSSLPEASQPDQVIAWFAPELPYTGGPDGYYGLPGTILELSYTGIHDHYVARSIDLSGKGAQWEIPTDGFWITKEQMVLPATHRIDRKALKAHYQNKKPTKPSKQN